MSRSLGQSAWPPGRNGFPVCPGCDEPITADPGIEGVVPDPTEGWKVGRHAHRPCAARLDQEGE